MNRGENKSGRTLRVKMSTNRPLGQLYWIAN